jgi:GntR family transcriptional regulator, arabinose operon transcriptional repressor
MKNSIQIEISHESVIPLHEQLLNQLRQFILSKRWQPGYRIPSETELQEQLKISRNTIRQALRNAEIEGLIERVPGRGTFVAQLQTRTPAKRPIAFVVFDFERAGQRNLLNGAESVAREAGYRVIFCNSNSDAEQEIRILAHLQEDDVAGILLWSSIDEGNPAHLARLSRQDFPPVTMMDRTFSDVNWDYVASHNYDGGYMAAQHLLDLCHQQIVFLSCRIMDLLPIAERYRGFQAALHEAGCPVMEPWLIGNPNQEITSPYTFKAYSEPDNPYVEQIVTYMRENHGKATAIFAMNDNVALLALKAAQIAGLRVPEDISIVGFDDMDFTSYLPTPLTTVAQNSYVIGRRAAELLIERIEGWYSGQPRSVYIPTHLCARASTTVLAYPSFDQP